MSDISDFLKDVDNGIIKKVSLDDTFQFECKKCGNCCTDRSDIIIYPYDAFLISKELNMTGEQFINKYCSYALGTNTKIPIIFLNIDKRCPFSIFDEENKIYNCKIQKVRPYLCAMYPLGRMTKVNVEENKKEIAYFLQPVLCKAKSGKTVKVSDFLNDVNAEMYDKLSNEYNEFMTELCTTIDFSKFFKTNKISAVSKDRFYSIFVTSLYDMPNHDNDIHEELNRQYKGLLGLFKKLAEGAKKYNADILPD